MLGVSHLRSSPSLPALLAGLLAGFALATSACSARQTDCWSARASAAPRPTSDTIEADLGGGWITVSVTLPRRPEGPKPVVISPIVDEQILLERGIGVVQYRTHFELLRGLKPLAAASTAGGSAREPAPAGEPEAELDGAEGGEQVGVWMLATTRPELVGSGYFRIITENARGSIPKVVDFLTTIPQVDPARISIAGSSTGGFTALQALAAEPRLAMGVVRVACGDYFLFLRKSRLALNDDPRWLPGGELVLDPEYAALLRDVQPVGQADRYPPRPLLLMAGEDDPSIPIECARRTAQALATAYDRAGYGDRFRFAVFPGQGHDLGQEADAEAMGWWERWLVGRAGP